MSKLDEALSSSDDFHVVEGITVRAPWKFIDAPLWRLDILGKNHSFTALHDVFIALRIYLTVPATTASGGFKSN